MVLIDYYSRIDGKMIKVEVSEEVAAVLESAKLTKGGKRRKEVKIQYEKFEEDADYVDDDSILEQQEEEILLQDKRELQKQVLHIALRTITPWQRKIITKRYYEDKLPGAIAKEFGISRIAVFKTLKAAYRSLHSFLASVRGAAKLYDEYSDGKYGLKHD